MKKKVLPFILSLLILLSTFNITSLAANVCYTNFYGAEYSSDPGQYMANIALAQNGRTGSDLGYSDQWCAYFVSDCARLAGQTEAIPGHGYVPTLYSNILNAGGTTIYDARNGTGSISNAKVGDIAILDTSTGGNTSRDHVEIVYDVSGSNIYTVGGNSGSGNSYATRKVTKHSPYSSSRVVYILRPNYTGRVQRDTRITVWASTNGGNGVSHYDCPEVTYGTTQNKYYIWYKIYDANTGELYNTYANDSYTATVSIRYSDGTTRYSNPYTNDDNAWIRVFLEKADNYTINITIPEWNVDFSRTFVVGYDADLISSKSSVTLDLQGNNSSTITLTPSGSYPGYKGMLVNYDENFIQINSNGWNNDVYSLSFSGLKAGKTTITADLYEGYTGNKNVVASVTINVTINGPSYTLSYNANGGSGAPSSQTGGSEYVVSMDMPTRAGYTFAGWSTSSSASNGLFFPMDKITIPSNKTLYAVWKPATTISTGTTTVSPAFRNQTVCYKFIPSVSGTYKFTGVISSGSNSATGFVNNLYLYNSSGTCLINTASSSTSKAEFTYNLVAGNTYYFTTQRYSVIMTGGDYDVSVSLVSASSYTLSYSANGGSGAPSSQSGATSYTISSTVPTRFGYTFLGWSKSSSATSASYEPSDSISISSGTTLYAVWKVASAISANTSYPAVINFANQEVYYSFTPSSSGDYIFESIGSLDSRVYVYTSSGTEIGYDDDSSDEGNNFKLTVNLTSGTKYYVKVRAYGSNKGSTAFNVIKKAPATYTLSYSSNGGSGAPSSQSGATSYTISSTVPTRFGYNFLGWSKSSSATSATYESGDTITLNSNTTLYAVWSQPQISVNSSATANIVSGGQVYYFKLRPSAGASYVIYSTGNSDTKAYLYDSNGNEVENNDDGGDDRNFRICRNLTGGSDYILAVEYYNSSTTGNIPVKFGYAYGIYYYDNGGTGAPDDQIKDYDKDITLSSTVPTRSGYTFLGWSTSSSSTTVVYSAGDTYSSNSSAYLYAVWSNNDTTKPTVSISSTNNVAASQTVTLSLSDNVGVVSYYWGTSSSPSSSSFTSVTSATSKTITKTVSTAGTYYLIAKDAAGNISTSASVVFYKTTLNANGGTVSPSYVITKSGNSFALPTAIRSGYTLLGWATSSTATSATFSANISLRPTASSTLYAVWSVNTSNLTVNSSNNATISAGGETQYYNFTPSESGTYVIYSTGSEDTKVYLYNSNGTELEHDDDGGTDRNFRLQYDLNAGSTYRYEVVYYDSSKTGTIAFKFGKVYTVSYNANGGSGAPSSQSKDYGTDLTLSSTVPTRTGYTFLGWATSSTATSVTYSAGSSYTANANATLYAVWRANIYAVKYNANGGSGTMSNSSHTYNVSKALTNNAFTRSGYTFLGWATSSSATTATYTNGQSVKNLTSTDGATVNLYAVWQEIEPEVMLGDVNGDDVIDAGDAVIISRYDAGLITLTQDQLAAADINKDGCVDAGDAVIISRYDAGLITTLNNEEEE